MQHLMLAWAPCPACRPSQTGTDVFYEMGGQGYGNGCAVVAVSSLYCFSEIGAFNFKLLNVKL